MKSVTVNGQSQDVRGQDARAVMIDQLHRCSHGKAAPEFEKWRSNRRITNVAGATVVGMWPFAIGIVSAKAAEKHRREMEHIVLTGMTSAEKRLSDKEERKAARRR